MSHWNSSRLCKDNKTNTKYHTRINILLYAATTLVFVRHPPSGTDTSNTPSLPLTPSVHVAPYCNPVILRTCICEVNACYATKKDVCVFWCRLTGLMPAGLFLCAPTTSACCSRGAWLTCASSRRQIHWLNICYFFSLANTPVSCPWRDLLLLPTSPSGSFWLFGLFLGKDFTYFHHLVLSLLMWNLLSWSGEL